MARSSNSMQKTITSLRIIFRQSFYRKVAIGVSVAVAYLSYWLMYQVTTFQAFWDMMLNGDFGKYSFLYGVTYIITSLLMIGLSGVSFAVMVWLFTHSKLARGKSIGANVGAFVSGMLGMGCPVCGAFLLSALGVAGGLSTFPLQGLELKFLGLGLLTASTVFGASKVKKVSADKDCDACVVPLVEQIHETKMEQKEKAPVVVPLQKIFVFILAGIFLLNQLLIGQAVASMGITPQSNSFVGQLFGIKTASAAMIIAPKINPDGRTTSLVEQPTITEVPANPNTGDAVADAKAVMFPTGKPFYAPDDISFDDPINAQKKWKSIGFGLQLTAEQEARWKGLTNTFTCNYCCGGPNNVTPISRCGCAHSFAWQGFFRYMIATYGDKYTDEQLKGEAYRWTGIWYPKGVLEDYLLATGKGNALGHQTHGGAGSDGNHGL